MTEEAHESAVYSRPVSWPISSLNRQKAILLASSLLLVGAVWALLAPSEPDVSPLATQIIDLTLPQRDELAEQPTTENADRAGSNDLDEWDSVTVKSGQNLDTIFRQQGFEVALLHRILELNGDTKGLTRLRVGDVFDFKRDAAGGLLEMRYPVGEDRYLLVRQVGDELYADSLPRQMYTEVIEAEGTITSSLFMAGRDA
ncbi:MAG TPA: LysM-like peptidoglycan-binding domain-containing protein, partial [Xanthomonadales bacterium]|nr:LysM-like peptidoglycan-binding domain-containing protein [Xanthomonadales bacterium]